MTIGAAVTVQNLVTATFENENSNTKDQTKLSLVITSNALLNSANLDLIWGLFLNQHLGTHGLGEYLATCVTRSTPGLTAAYDITSHLDGSVHGSPYVTSTFTPPASVGDSRGNQLTAVLAFVTAAYASTPTTGATAAIPTPEQAQDYGAPATHTGVTRLKARQSNRMYLGPLSSTAIGVDGNANPQFTDTFMTDASLHLANFMGNIGADITGAVWGVWSRRNAAVVPVDSGWVDRSVKTRRGKAFVGNLKTTWP